MSGFLGGERASQLQPSADQLVARARERFVLQDYHGAVHLLEEVAATGHAFADAHHLLGDGSVRFLSENLDVKVYDALATRNSGEIIGEF